MESRDYKYLYLKYKKKYLNLKQIGGKKKVKVKNSVSNQLPFNIGSTSRPTSTQRQRQRQRQRSRLLSTPRRSLEPVEKKTAKSQYEYSKFFNDVSAVLYCIIIKYKRENNINLNISAKNSGMYLNIDRNLYLSIHTTSFKSNGINYVKNRFHINQGTNQFSLAIQYRGNKLVIDKKIDNFQWDNVDSRMKKLLSIIEECVNNYNLYFRELEQQNKNLQTQINRLEILLNECVPL